MTYNPTYYRGNNAIVKISGQVGVQAFDWKSHSIYAISDFSLTLSKGTAEQELLGEIGNYFLAGSMTAEGSLSACKLHTGAIADLVGAMINGSLVRISGQCGPNSLHFFFKSCQITGFDFSMGTADDITEGSIDFTLLLPYKVSGVKYTGDFSYITDSSHIG